MQCLIKFIIICFKQILVLLLIFIMLNDVAPFAACNSLQFHYPSFQQSQNISNLRLLSQNDWYHSANAYFSDSGALWLTSFNDKSLNGATEADSSNLGRVIYNDPVQFVSNSSFSTSFTFQIITTRPFPNCGSGIAFFIAESLQAPNNSDSKGALGLVDPFNQVRSSFFAVEFDTRLSSNFYDPSSSHIGIDIDSLISLNVTDTSPSTASSGSFYPQLFLYNNSTFTAWIEYNASNHLIQVWMAPNQSIAPNSSGVPGSSLSAANRPPYPCLQLQYDLSSVFLQKSMYVGFSATSAPSVQGMEGHVIYSWSFSMYSVTSHSPASIARHSGFKLYLALVLTVAGLALIAIAVVWMCMKRKRNRKKQANAGRIENALQTARPFSYKELKRATNDFDEKLKVGQGGYGCVYKGILSDGSVVAVKRLGMSLRLEAQFCAEASIIRKVRHRYLLELQGWCYEDGREALLVSQYMSKGSLDSYLFDERKKMMLGSSAMAQKETRIRILAQVAAALEYLHGGLGECVLHRDVKAANVLLTDDKEVEARLCDFGLARLIKHDEGAVAITVAGTPGHVAPEVLYDGVATDKADVFSFGVLVLEVACGRRATSCDEQHLSQWLWSELNIQGDRLLSEEQISQALDPILLMEIVDGIDIDNMETMRILQDWRCVLHVGLLCCHPRAECRPSMKEVSRAFDNKLIFPLPKVKPAFLYEYSSTSAMSNNSDILVQVVPQNSSSNEEF